MPRGDDDSDFEEEETGKEVALPAIVFTGDVAPNDPFTADGAAAVHHHGARPRAPKPKYVIDITVVPEGWKYPDSQFLEALYNDHAAYDAIVQSPRLSPTVCASTARALEQELHTQLAASPVYLNALLAIDTICTEYTKQYITLSAKSGIAQYKCPGQKDFQDLVVKRVSRYLLKRNLRPQYLVNILASSWDQLLRIFFKDFSNALLFWMLRIVFESMSCVKQATPSRISAHMQFWDWHTVQLWKSLPSNEKAAIYESFHSGRRSHGFASFFRGLNADILASVPLHDPFMEFAAVKEALSRLNLGQKIFLCSLQKEMVSAIAGALPAQGDASHPELLVLDLARPFLSKEALDFLADKAKEIAENSDLNLNLSDFNTKMMHFWAGIEDADATQVDFKSHLIFTFTRVALQHAVSPPDSDPKPLQSIVQDLVVQLLCQNDKVQQSVRKGFTETRSINATQQKCGWIQFMPDAAHYQFEQKKVARGGGGSQKGRALHKVKSAETKDDNEHGTNDTAEEEEEEEEDLAKTHHILALSRESPVMGIEAIRGRYAAFNPAEMSFLWNLQEKCISFMHENAYKPGKQKRQNSEHIDDAEPDDTLYIQPLNSDAMRKWMITAVALTPPGGLIHFYLALERTWPGLLTNPNANRNYIDTVILVLSSTVLQLGSVPFENSVLRNRIWKEANQYLLNASHVLKDELAFVQAVQDIGDTPVGFARFRAPPPDYHLSIEPIVQKPRRHKPAASGGASESQHSRKSSKKSHHDEEDREAAHSGKVSKKTQKRREKSQEDMEESDDGGETGSAVLTKRQKQNHAKPLNRLLPMKAYTNAIGLQKNKQWMDADLDISEDKEIEDRLAESLNNFSVSYKYVLYTVQLSCLQTLKDNRRALADGFELKPCTPKQCKAIADDIEAACHAFVGVNDTAKSMYKALLDNLRPLWPLLLEFVSMSQQDLVSMSIFYMARAAFEDFDTKHTQAKYDAAVRFRILAYEAQMHEAMAKLDTEELQAFFDSLDNFEPLMYLGFGQFTRCFVAPTPLMYIQWALLTGNTKQNQKRFTGLQQMQDNIARQVNSRIENGDTVLFETEEAADLDVQHVLEDSGADIEAFRASQERLGTVIGKWFRRCVNKKMDKRGRLLLQLLLYFYDKKTKRERIANMWNTFKEESQGDSFITSWKYYEQEKHSHKIGIYALNTFENPAFTLQHIFESMNLSKVQCKLLIQMQCAVLTFLQTNGSDWPYLTRDHLRELTHIPEAVQWAKTEVPNQLRKLFFSMNRHWVVLTKPSTAVSAMNSIIFLQVKRLLSVWGCEEHNIEEEEHDLCWSVDIHRFFNAHSRFYDSKCEELFNDGQHPYTDSSLAFNILLSEVDRLKLKNILHPSSEKHKKKANLHVVTPQELGGMSPSSYVHSTGSRSSSSSSSSSSGMSVHSKQRKPHHRSDSDRDSDHHSDIAAKATDSRAKTSSPQDTLDGDVSGDDQTPPSRAASLSGLNRRDGGSARSGSMGPPPPALSPVRPSHLAYSGGSSASFLADSSLAHQRRLPHGTGGMTLPESHMAHDSNLHHDGDGAHDWSHAGGDGQGGGFADGFAEEQTADLHFGHDTDQDVFHALNQPNPNAFVPQTPSTPWDQPFDYRHQTANSAIPASPWNPSYVPGTPAIDDIIHDPNQPSYQHNDPFSGLGGAFGYGRPHN